METLDYEDKQTTEEESLVSLKLITHNTRLVETRKAKGIKQTQMAEDISMSPTRLSWIENLKRVPTEDDMVKISAYLVETVDYLFPPLLMKAIEEGVFSRRDAQLAEPEILNLTEAARLRLTYNGETEMIAEMDRKLLAEHIHHVLNTLEPREQKVLRLRFGLDSGTGLRLEDVGKEFGVTRERIRQIESKALRKLRHPSRSRRLKDYLDLDSR